MAILAIGLQPTILPWLQLRRIWRHLVLNEKLSGSSQKKIAALSMEEILAIQAETPFTRKEEALIHDLSLTDSPNLANMEMLLKKHPNVFHPARTARTLLDHWRKMVGNKKDRHGCQMKETNTSKEDVREKPAEKTEEPAVVQQVFERPRAKLQGRFCCFEIYRDEMMIGRSVDETEVDVELAMEDPEEDIWGIQAIVAFLPNTGKFQITNVGVKGLHLCPGTTTALFWVSLVGQATNMFSEKEFFDGDSQKGNAADDPALSTAASNQGQGLRDGHDTVKFGENFTLEEVVERWRQPTTQPVNLVGEDSKQNEANDPEVENDAGALNRRMRQLNLNDEVQDLPQNETGDVPMDNLRDMEAEELENDGGVPNRRMRHINRNREVQGLPEIEIGDVSMDNLGDMQGAQYFEMENAQHVPLFHRQNNAAVNEPANRIGTFRDRVVRQAIREEPRFDDPIFSLRRNRRPRAELRGSLCNFQILRDEVLIGRSIADTKVDVNLALEDPNEQIWGIQAILVFLPLSGRFLIRNVGIENIYVNDTAVTPGTSTILPNNSLIQFIRVRLTFKIIQ
ncbi:hypothetical protein Q1695_000274 [Nippostrongylus brasiliensis]|nr:hypothetical protein Q1695_000274 [Nippostrongylus brasiliensis]